MKFLLLFSLLTFLHTQCTFSQTPQKGYKNWYIGNFRSGVYVPPNYDASKKYPLLIYLHGKGDTTTRNIGWYHEPGALADPCIILTPKCPLTETGEWGNTMNATIPPMIKKTLELVEMIKKQYNIDEDRLYIYGISMGAIGTFGLIQKYPDMFAGGYAVCGWSSREIAPQLAKVPFWIFHGDQDDIVPVEGSRGIYNAVVAYGGTQIKYTEFKGVKHDAQNYLPNNVIYPWLLAQRKNSKHNKPVGVIEVTGKKSHQKVIIDWKKPVAKNQDDKVWYYKIYKNSTPIGEVSADTLSYTDENVKEYENAEYRVSVVNYYFKESALSKPVSVSMR